MAGLIIVIFVLVMIIKALAGSGSDETKPTPNPSTPKAAETPSGSNQDPAAAPACTTEQLTGGKLATGADILLSHDKGAYAEGEPVTLRAKVKNTSGEDCSLRNNPHNVVLTVVSGSDPIFDSSHCAASVAEDSGEVIPIKAGQTADIPITWDAPRSQQGCPEITQTPYRHEGATYVASVKIMGVTSDETQFLLIP